MEHAHPKNTFIPFSTPGRNRAKACHFGTPLSKEDTPGPCAYFWDEAEQKPEKQPSTGKKKTVKKTPFGSSSTRFTEVRTDANLGPGVYETINVRNLGIFETLTHPYKHASISDVVLKKKLESGGGSFGSQANRFNYKIQVT